MFVLQTRLVVPSHSIHVGHLHLWWNQTFLLASQSRRLVGTGNLLLSKQTSPIIFTYTFLLYGCFIHFSIKKNIHTHKKQISANLPSSVAIHQTIYSIPCHSVQNHNINLIHQGFSTPPPPPPRFVTTIQKGKLKSASNPNDETTTKKRMHRHLRQSMCYVCYLN